MKDLLLVGVFGSTSIYTHNLNCETAPNLTTSRWISIASSHVCMFNTNIIDPSTRSDIQKQEIEFNMYPYCTRKKTFPSTSNYKRVFH